jgi:hypothetical protein
MLPVEMPRVNGAQHDKLDGPVSKTGGRKADFSHPFTRPLGPTQPLVQ